MRKLFVGFVVSLVLIPSLVCAMPMCGNEMPSDEVMMAPCPDHPIMAEPEMSDIEIPMFLLDCLDADLLDTSKHAELSSSADNDNTYPGNDLTQTVFQQRPYLSQGAARAPPAPRNHLYPPEPSKIITTQRFRI